MLNITELQKNSTQVRRDVLRMIYGAKSGHPGGSLGCADFITVLYNGIMRHNPHNFDINGYNQDIFFLSNGHLSALWYSVLARSGYFDIKELSTFRKLNSRLQGHPSIAEGLPGIRIASGSLGQGLSNAIGSAIAKKLNNDNCLVYSLHGDGELQEGQIWEAILFAAAKKTDNLIATIDCNGKQIDGPVDKVLSIGDLKAKFKAFDWDVLEMNGNNIQEIIDTLKIAKNHTGKQRPVAILMKTEMGYGVDFMMGTHKWHGKAPDNEQTENALSQLKETIGDY